MGHGLLLVNLGTPNSPSVADVRRFLLEFLSDKRVIDLPAFFRYALIFTFILPLRSKQTAKNYQASWTAHGSPLLYHSQNLMNDLQKHVGADCTVALGMRYGQPSLSSALDRLKDCQSITILPLYPQYSSAASGSAI